MICIEILLCFENDILQMSIAHVGGQSKRGFEVDEELVSSASGKQVQR